MNKFLKLTLGLLLLFSIVGFTPPTANYTADAYDKLLIHADQADGTAGTDIIDSATSKTITAVADAQVDTAQYKNLTGSTGSVLFDGTGDALSLADSTDWYFNGDLTIDCWIRVVSIADSSHYIPIGFAQQTDSTHYMYFGFFNYWNGETSDVRMQILINTDADAEYQYNRYAATLPANEWHHYAWVRNGNNWSMFQDGVLLGTDTAALTMDDFTGTAYIGADWAGAALADSLWVDELRISKGIARDWLPTDTGDVMIIQYVKNFINNLNPDKLGTPMWSCKIKLMSWWRNGKLPVLQRKT